MRHRADTRSLVGSSASRLVVSFGAGALVGWLLSRPRADSREKPSGDQPHLSSTFSELLRSGSFRTAAFQQVAAPAGGAISQQQLYAWLTSITYSDHLAASKATAQGDQRRAESIYETDMAISRAYWAKALSLVQADIATVDGLAGTLKTAAEAIPQATKDLTKWATFSGALNGVTAFFVPKSKA